MPTRKHRSLHLQTNSDIFFFSCSSQVSSTLTILHIDQPGEATSGKSHEPYQPSGFCWLISFNQQSATATDRRRPAVDQTRVVVVVSTVRAYVPTDDSVRRGYTYLRSSSQFSQVSFCHARLIAFPGPAPATGCAMLMVGRDAELFC